MHIQTVVAYRSHIPEVSIYGPKLNISMHPISHREDSLYDDRKAIRRERTFREKSIRKVKAKS